MRMLNNIEIKQCLCIILGITSIAIVAMYFNISVLRQVSGFLFLTFVPGTLIIRILKIHNISIIETFGYTVGLSLTFIMFIGASTSFFLPKLGIENPISIYPILITFTTSILLLSAIAYIRDKRFIASKTAILPITFSAHQIYLLALPILAVSGALVVNYYQNSILLLLLIAAIAITVALISFDKFIPKEAYGLAIIAIGIALLYQNTLSSFVLPTTGDITREISYATSVIDNGYWNYARDNSLTSALSIAIINPIYSVVLNMNVLLIFKTIYPLLFFLVPLVLFHIYRIQLGDKVAFLATFFFMSVIYLSATMISVNRQQIAELFFVLCIAVLLSKKLSPTSKVILGTIFVLSITISHYALGYISIGIFAVAWFTLLLFRHRSKKLISQVVLISIIILYTSFTWAWYSETSSGKSIGSIKWITKEQITVVTATTVDSGITIEEGKVTRPEPESKLESKPEPKSTAKLNPIFDLSNREPLIQTALGLDFFDVSLQGKAFRIFQYITELFLIVGILGLLSKSIRNRFRPEFIALSMGAVLILIACIVLPTFSGHLESERFYQITLMLLSPMSIVGGIIICKIFTRNLSRRFKFITLGILIPYFMFTSGFIFEITQQNYEVRDTPSSPGLSGYRLLDK